MKPWHFARIKINQSPPWWNDERRPLPCQASNGKWIFFHIFYRTGDKYSPFRQTYQTMTTIGLDGVE